ncbi:MAG: adenosylhomocysteinase, partial [Eubacteriales bacterium]|nr:adenosylhomocysteinase [Eubacteriales bacterium]
MHRIRDISLAPLGEQKIEWVRRNMPILNGIRASFERDLPFRGLKIALSIHLEAKTAYLCRVLAAGGAEMYATGSNPLSTQDDVAAALAAGGIHVFALHGCTMQEYDECVESVLLSDPDIVIDDGGDLVHAIHTRHTLLIGKILGGCEETTTGITRLVAMEKAKELRFPMFAVNNADCKHLFDNRYGTGQSVFDGINHTTNLVIAGKTVVVAGYGWCGKGVAMRAKGLGANVIVTEVDPVKAIEAVMDGFSVMPMIEAAKLGDLFITVTGDIKVIDETEFCVMKDGAILTNAGHFDVEVNVHRLAEIAVDRKEMRQNIVGFQLPNGRWLNVIAEGRLVNLAAGNGHPAEIMDMSFSLQALGALYIARNAGKLKPGVHAIPEDIDRSVAEMKLKAFGGHVDTLTKRQAEYL